MVSKRQLIKATDNRQNWFLLTGKGQKSRDHFLTPDTTIVPTRRRAYKLHLLVLLPRTDWLSIRVAFVAGGFLEQRDARVGVVFR